jgi:hypothetical protein
MLWCNIGCYRLRTIWLDFHSVDATQIIISVHVSIVFSSIQTTDQVRTLDDFRRRHWQSSWNWDLLLSSSRLNVPREMILFNFSVGGETSDCNLGTWLLFWCGADHVALLLDLPAFSRQSLFMMLLILEIHSCRSLSRIGVWWSM